MLWGRFKRISRRLGTGSYAVSYAYVYGLEFGV